MSLEFLSKLQKHIYESLYDNDELMTIAKKIYIGPMQNGDLPCLSLQIYEAENQSVTNQLVYSVGLQINAFANDNHHQQLILMADLVNKSILSTKNRFHDYQISSLRQQNIVFSKSNDLVLNKLSIDYKILIKEV